MSDQHEAEVNTKTEQGDQVAKINQQATESISYKKRRERRPLNRSPRSSPLVGVVNSLILVIGLTLILASRCEQSDQASSQDESWLNHLITPKDLHLPKSVTDKLTEKSKQVNPKKENLKSINHTVEINTKLSKPSPESHQSASEVLE